MPLNWTTIKEFIALPAAKQVVGGLLLVVASLTVVIIAQDRRVQSEAAGRLKCETTCGSEKLALQREYSDSVKVLIQGFGQEKERIYQGRWASWKRRKKAWMKHYRKPAT